MHQPVGPPVRADVTDDELALQAEPAPHLVVARPRPQKVQVRTVWDHADAHPPDLFAHHERFLERRGQDVDPRGTPVGQFLQPTA